MPRYQRAKRAGGTFFFTVAIADRDDDLLVREIERLRHAYRITQQRRPFETIAICILPDHLHAIWSLPDNDSDFQCAGASSRAASRAVSWLRLRAPRDTSRSVRKGCGNAATGSTSSAMRQTCIDTSTTFTTIG